MYWYVVGKFCKILVSILKKLKVKVVSTLKHSLTDDPTVSQHTINASADTALGNEVSYAPCLMNNWCVIAGLTKELGKSLRHSC